MQDTLLNDFERLSKLFRRYHKLYQIEEFKPTLNPKTRAEKLYHYVQNNADSLYYQTLKLGKKLGKKLSYFGIKAYDLKKHMDDIGNIKENIDDEKEEKFGENLYSNKKYTEPIFGESLIKYLFGIK